MFERNTLFILVAEASVPYGYPIGKELIHQIIKAIEEDSIFLPIPPGEKKSYLFNDNDKEKYDMELFLNELEKLDNSFDPKIGDPVKTNDNPNMYVFQKDYYLAKISKIKQSFELKNDLIAQI